MPPHPLTLTPAEFEQTLESAPHLNAFVDLCRSREIPVYLVGGAVRDLLFKGVLSQDLDLVVPKEVAQSVAQAIADQLDGKCICLDESFQIYRVILFPTLEMFDVAGCVGPDIQADLRRRDLTINAIAYDFQTHKLLDPTGGQRDLADGVIRMISPENLLEDPLRLLRVFRFSAELGFSQIDADTLAVIAHHGQKLIRSAPERIHYELMKLFSVPTCYRQVRHMADIGLLEYIFPELSATHAIPSNQYHHLGLFDHTLELLNQLEVHFPDLPTSTQKTLMASVNPFTKRIALVRLACLFHDIGKPATMKVDPAGGKAMFYGHDAVSAEITYGIAIRLKWGKEITKAVAQLVRWHLYPGDLLKPDVTPKAYRKFFRRIEALIPEMIALAIADRYSTQGPLVTQDDLIQHKQGLLALLERYETFQATEAKMPQLLGGEEIMDILGIAPGPSVGKVLKAMTEAQLNGEITTPTEAKQWIQTFYTHMVQ